MVRKISGMRCERCGQNKPDVIYRKDPCQQGDPLCSAFSGNFCDSCWETISKPGIESISALTEKFFKAAKKHKDQIPGGLADKKQPKDFDKKQLAKGKKVEMEHTDDPKKAIEIAMDHLTEDPKYYDKLEKMEKGKHD